MYIKYFTCSVNLLFSYCEFVKLLIINCYIILLGKGLTLVASVIEGDFNTQKDKAEVARNALNEAMKQEKTKGFADVIIAKDIAEGLSYL